MLVLVPGTQEAAGSLAFAGRDIQAALGSDWQVWAQDRREQAFEDPALLRARTPRLALGYYFGDYRRLTTGDVPYVRKWGLKVALNDLHRVIRAARAGGRQVVLGGHSLGAQEALAYAAWDFGGRAGYRDLSGLVLIDGGMLGSFSSALSGDDLTRVLAQKSGIDFGPAFEDMTGHADPRVASLLPALAAMYARSAPDAASPLAANPLVTPSLRPPFPVTNAAFLGQMFDATYSRPGFEALRVRIGDFAPSGSPRPWVDGENATVARLADALAQASPAWAESYFPRRLSLDVRAADSMRRSKVGNFLGLRVWHAREINLPLYAYQTDLTQGGVLRGARSLVQRSRIPRFVAVDDSATASHLDPLIAPRPKNGFLQTVVPFLQSLAGA